MKLASLQELLKRDLHYFGTDLPKDIINTLVDAMERAQRAPCLSEARQFIQDALTEVESLAKENIES